MLGCQWVAGRFVICSAAGLSDSATLVPPSFLNSNYGLMGVFSSLGCCSCGWFTVIRPRGTHRLTLPITHSQERERKRGRRRTGERKINERIEKKEYEMRKRIEAKEKRGSEKKRAGNGLPQLLFNIMSTAAMELTEQASQVFPRSYRLPVHDQPQRCKLTYCPNNVQRRPDRRTRVKLFLLDELCIIACMISTCRMSLVAPVGSLADNDEAGMTPTRRETRFKDNDGGCVLKGSL
ncbi:hypothetical protein PBY51_006621 [Eleginops maclovinus]|uniref:Uncharacterized protein n=1 Tax=Eleginops maclovinus TaxID=56733 RepID=A0AAN7X1Z1_ELEMC|nr:hypothetical protein PBY51_006621 [Eleginops maclovinus]